mmetsp:Transcript_7794/g.9350  ORF Transcript_7794/g.9350 Transcript_7794/m.9350 type:complete len:92 (+) Transcript_7794:817-1092(+)
MVVLLMGVVFLLLWKITKYKSANYNKCQRKPLQFTTKLVFQSASLELFQRTMPYSGLSKTSIHRSHKKILFHRQSFQVVQRVLIYEWMCYK